MLCSQGLNSTVKKRNKGEEKDVCVCVLCVGGEGCRRGGRGETRVKQYIFGVFFNENHPEVT